MVYLLTRILESPSGMKQFDPHIDAVVFESYVTALRRYVNEKNKYLRGGYYMSKYLLPFRGTFGNAIMYSATFQKDGWIYTLTISRVTCHSNNDLPVHRYLL